MKFTDLILQTATKLLVFIILTFSVYVLFNGHHHPGGGFIGGLITSSAVVLLYIAFDAQTVREYLPIDFKLVGVVGVLLAVGTATTSLLLGQPFLTGHHVEVTLPFIGELELGSALIFDIGVYLTVIGTTLTIITSISRDE